MDAPIILFAFKGKSVLSKAIQFRTNGPYSHVAYAVNKNSYVLGNIPLVIEAWRGWVRVADANYSHSQGTPYDVIEIHTDLPKQMAFESFISKQIYKKYDFMAMLNFICNRSYDPTVNNDGMTIWDNKDKWFCSELIAEGLIQAEILGKEHRPALTDPTALIKAIQNHTDWSFVRTAVTSRGK